eukprot:m51a1_g9049 putative adenylate guanylate cyclase (661) ;mRNA; f:22623-28238
MNEVNSEPSASSSSNSFASSSLWGSNADKATSTTKALWSSMQRISYTSNCSFPTIAQYPASATSTTSVRSWSTTAGHSSVKFTNYGRVVALTLALELLQLALVPLDLILESTASGPGTAQHSVARGVRAAWSFGSDTGAGAAWASGAVTLVAWVVPFGRIESIRYGTAQKLHMAVVVSLLLVGTCLTLEYTLSQQRADKFSNCVRMIDTSVGLRMNLYKTLIEVRGLDNDMRSFTTAKVLSRIAKIRNYSLDFESRFSEAFINSDNLAQIAEFWTMYRLPIRQYVSGENATVFDSSRFVDLQMPLWDAGTSLLNHVRDLCAAMGKDPNSHKCSQDVLGLAITVVLPRDFECNAQVLREIESSTTQSTGKRISSLEVKVSCKDETTRDALLSMGKTVEREAVSYALFLRDISQLKQRQAELSEKQEAAEKLLYNILPRTLVHEMAQRGIEGREMTMARAHAGATILFADIVDFTQLTGGLEADAVVLVLNGLVSEWDRLAVELGVEKIKTIGSCFMAAAGVPQEFAEHAEAMMEFAIAMLWETKARNKTARIPLSIRIGVNTGKVVAGVLGLHKIAFDLWGDTVNVAARMQTSCPPDRIQVSEATFAALQGKGYAFQERERLLIKGKGEMNCYVLELPAPPELDVLQPSQTTGCATTTSTQ